MVLPAIDNDFEFNVNVIDGWLRRQRKCSNFIVLDKQSLLFDGMRLNVYGERKRIDIGSQKQNQFSH